MNKPMPVCFLVLAALGFFPLSAQIPASDTIQAELNVADSSGIDIDPNSIGSLHFGDWVQFSPIDFNDGSARFLFLSAAVGAENANQKLEFRLDALDGPVIATHTMSPTGNWFDFQFQSAPMVMRPTGVHTVYVLFDVDTLGDPCGNLDWISFSSTPPPGYNRDAPETIEVESFHNQYGLQVRGEGLGAWTNGEWAYYKDVDFGSTSYDSVVIKLALGESGWGKYLHFVLDSLDGDVFAVHSVRQTGGWRTYEDQKSALSSSPTGVHDVYVLGVFNQGLGGGLGNVDHIFFAGNTRPYIATQPTADTVGIGVPGNFYITAHGAAPLQYSWKRISSDTVTDAGSGASLLLGPSQLSENGDRYFCEVSNSLGTTFSDTAILTVIDSVFPPIVSVTPEAVTSPVDEAVTFSSVLSQGVASTVSYQWQKDGVNITGANNSSFTVSPVSYADRGDYRVIASNSSGTDTSNSGLLTVDYTPARVTATTTFQYALVGTDITFGASVQGSSPTVQWFRTSGNQPLSTTATLTLSNVQLSDDNSLYFAVVSNDAGPDTSALCTLRVVQEVAAAFSADAFFGIDSLPVVFTDQSTGSIRSWTWDFGDGTVENYTTKQATVSHTYKENGDYTASLTVRGPSIAGDDIAYSRTLYLRDSLTNMLQIDALLTSANTAELSIRDFADIEDANPFASNYADSIGIWLSTDGGSVDPSSDPDWTFDVDDVQATDSVFRTGALTIPDPGGRSDTVYLFWVSPIWGNKDLNFDEYNTARLRMAPQNPLALDAVYLGNTGSVSNVQLDTLRLDSVEVSVSGVFSVDRGTADSAVLAWRIATDQSWEEQQIPSSDLTDLASGNTFRWGIESQRFVGDTQAVIVRVMLLGRNGLRSDPAVDSVVVGWPGTPNPYVLTAGDPKATTIALSWNQVSDAEGIRILYSTDSLSPGPVLVDEGTIGIASPEVSATSYTVQGLRNATRYFVGIQMLKNRQWTELTDASIIAVVTDAIGDGDAVANTTTLDSVWFDDSQNVFHLDWTVAPSAVVLELGISYSTDSVTATTTEPAADNYDLVIVDIDETGIAEVDLGNRLRFDTTYYFSLWLRTTNGPWAPPQASSIGAGRTPKTGWQAVRLFSSDEISLYNDRVVLWKDSTYRPPVSAEYDTVRVAALPSTPNDYVRVGPSVSLSRNGIDSFFVGIRYDSIPSGSSAGDLGLFRDSAGVILAVHNSVVAPERNLVYAKMITFLNESGTPASFQVLADQKAPSISLSGGENPVEPNKELPLAAHISDNTANVFWKVLYARDDEIWSEKRSISGIACGSCGSGDSIRATIPARQVTEAVGMRALLITNDGAHRDTVDISRSVRRDNSDAVVSQSGEWMPLWATADLDTPSVEYALSDLAPKGKAWSYDIKKFRLFRYLPHRKNKDKAQSDRWLEYSGDTKDLFAFTPGRVMWVKGRAGTQIGLGTARTPSMTDTIEIPFPALEWADFALPYSRFSVRIGDILEASGADGESVDLYEWYRETGGSRYTTRCIYSTSLPSGAIGERSDALRSYTRRAYSLYNASSKAGVLKIPPTPAGLSAYAPAPDALARKKNNENAWIFRVYAKTRGGVELGPVYVAFEQDSSRGATFLPLSPSFSLMRMGVGRENERSVGGHMVAHRLKNGGFSSQLVFLNAGTSDEILEVRVERDSTTPSSVFARVLTDSPESAGNSLALKAGERAERTLAIGSKEYVSRVRVASSRPLVHGIAPNPFRGPVTMRYYTPAASVAEVDVRIFDSRGRMVWKTIDRRSGSQLLRWDTVDRKGRQVGTGVYIVQIRFLDYQGREKGHFRQPITCMPR